MAMPIVSKLKIFLLANIENFLFSVSTTATSFALVLCSIYTFFLLFSGGFMNCVTPGDTSSLYRELAPNSKFCFNARSSTPLGSKSDDEKEIIKHNLYIWTPYILLVQAILFYLPKYILKHFERDTFEMAMVSFVNVDVEKTTSKEKRNVKFCEAYMNFLDRLLARRHFALGPIFCEIINVGIVTLQIYAMKVNLGTKFYEDVYSGNPFDVVFPKSLECVYHGVLGNGTITRTVAKCDMPINYANEIIYTYLWIWVNLLLGLATLVILYRLLSMHLYCRWNAYNRFEFGRVCSGPMNHGNLMVVTVWGFPRWMTLRRLAGQLSGEEFSLLIDVLESEVDNAATCLCE